METSKLADLSPPGFLLNQDLEILNGPIKLTME